MIERLRASGERDLSNRQIIDAEWEEVGAPARNAAQENSRSSLWRSVRNGIRIFIMAVGVLVVGLIVLGALIPGPSGNASLNHPTADAGSDTPEMNEASAQKATPASSDNKPSIIDSCYHLDSCGAWKLVQMDLVRQRGDERLLKAQLQWGDVADPVGNESDWDRIKWSERREPFYVLCSKRRPSIAFRDASAWMATEFDFSADIPGVEEDDAAIYGALCHGLFNGEFDQVSTQLGYQSLAGGSQQYKLANPEDLLR